MEDQEDGTPRKVQRLTRTPQSLRSLQIARKYRRFRGQSPISDVVRKKLLARFSATVSQGSTGAQSDHGQRGKCRLNTCDVILSCTSADPVPTATTCTPYTHEPRPCMSVSDTVRRSLLAKLQPQQDAVEECTEG